MKKFFTFFLLCSLSCIAINATVYFDETFATRRGSNYIIRTDQGYWPYASQWFTGYAGYENNTVEGNQYDNDYTDVTSYSVSVRGKRINGEENTSIGLYFGANKPKEQDYITFSGGFPNLPFNMFYYLHFEICSSEQDGGNLNEMVVKVNDIEVPVPSTTFGEKCITRIVSIPLPVNQIDSLSFAFDNTPIQKFINHIWIDDEMWNYDEVTFDWNPEDGVLTFNGIGSIPDYPFEGTSTPWGNNQEAITSIVINDGITRIGDYAFYGCSNLTSLTIPCSVTNIGKDAFDGCNNMRSVVAPAMFLNDDLGFNCSRLHDVTINCGELTSDGFDRIRNSYRTLESMDLSMAENVEFPDVALRGCYNLQSLILPSNLERIGYMAIAECKNLQEINLPTTVTEISQSAFENCRSLNSITLGSQLESIGEWAFFLCIALENILIPEGVTNIGNGAFYGCTYLNELTLPQSLQTIGDNSFALCSRLQKMVVRAVTPPDIENNTFAEVLRTIPVVVPGGSAEIYRNHSLWGEFFIQEESSAPSSVETISNLQSPITNKVIRDGVLFILRDDRTYTLTGQEVK